jgi:hypothetical protein
LAGEAVANGPVKGVHGVLLLTHARGVGVDEALEDAVVLDTTADELMASDDELVTTDEDLVMLDKELSGLDKL